MKQVRIIEFLRDCPVYTRLYSPLYGYCEFLECSQNFIFVRGSKPDSKHNKCSDTVYKFNEIGQPCGTVYEDNEIEYSECMLFPSHTYKSWKNWQEHLFKDGDIIVENTPDAENRNMFKYKCFDACYGYNGTPFIVPPSELKKYRYATKEEQIQFRELQEKFEKDNNGARKQLDLKETVEITNNIIKKQAKTWGRLHPAYALAENMGLLDDEDILEDMYEKHRTDTFRVVCELFCCDPKEVLRKMLEHRNEVLPKIIEAEKKSIAEANTKATDNDNVYPFKKGDTIIHKDYEAFLDVDIPPSPSMLERLFKVEIGGKTCLRCQKTNGDKIFITRDDLKDYRCVTDEEMRKFINRWHRLIPKALALVANEKLYGLMRELKML